MKTPQSSRVECAGEESGWRRFAVPAENHGHVALSLILLLAVSMRILALLSMKQSIYDDYLLSNEAFYHNWAIKIASGVYASSSVYDLAPLPAYLMAFIYKIFSANILIIRLMNIVFGVLTCYLAFFIGKELGSRRTGLLACLIAALYKPFIFYSIVPLKTSLAVVMFALCVYMFMRVLDRPSLIFGVLLGAISGLLVNVRPNYLAVVFLIVFFSLYHLRTSPGTALKHVAIFLLGVALALAPFVIRNYRVTGVIAVTPSQAGYNLYLGNRLENKTPYYKPVPFAAASPDLQGTHFVIEASRRRDKKLSPQEASSYWIGQVLNLASAQPSALMRKIGQKTLALFSRFEAGDHYHIGFVSDFIRFFKIPLPSLWLILPLGMAGMAVSFRVSKIHLACCAVFFLFGLTLVAFFINARYRLPMVTVLIPFAAVGLERLYSAFKNHQHKRVLIYLFTALIFSAVAFLPIRGTRDLTKYHNTHALILDSVGREDEATDYWKRSSRLKESWSAAADFRLAIRSFNQGDKLEGFSYLNRIPDTSFVAAAKYELVGDFWWKQGSLNDAVTAYDRSLQINSGQRNVRKKLIRILKEVDPLRAMVEYEKLSYIKSFYEGVK